MTPLFTWPTESRVVTGGFTDRRSYGQHNGIDIAAPLSASVRSVAPGRVAFAGRAGSCGLGVFVDHADGWRSHYCHLNRIRVLAGQVVTHASTIGDVGSTGESAGPHLHLNLFSPTKPTTGPSSYVAWVARWAVDPLNYLTEEEPMAKLIKGSTHKVYVTDGVWKWHIPTSAVLNELRQKGLVQGSIIRVSNGLIKRLKNTHRF